MGNRLTRENAQLKQLMDRFDILEKLPERNVMFLQDKHSHKEYVLKEATFNDLKEYQKNVEKLIAKKALLDGHPSVVPLEQYLLRTQDQFCSTFFKIYALFEYPYKTLADEIQERQLQHRNFREQELWSILASCILGLSHLQKCDIKHLSLKSSTIMLTSGGHIKIADPWCTSQPSNYQILLTKRSTPHIYLPPEHCTALAEQLTCPQLTNPYKSDVFTIGMIMLEAGLLQFQDECYRDETSRIYWDTVRFNLERFGEKYSEELKTTIEGMLEEAWEERPEWVELEKHVKVGAEEEEVSSIPPTPISRASEMRQTDSVVRRTHENNDSRVRSVVNNSFLSTGPVELPQPHTIIHVGSTHSRPQSHQSQQQIPRNSQAAVQPTLQPLANPVPSMKRTQPPVIQPMMGEIMPVKRSVLDGPVFSFKLPANSYNTYVKYDENLVQVTEDDQDGDPNFSEHDIQSVGKQTPLKLTAPTVTMAANIANNIIAPPSSTTSSLTKQITTPQPQQNPIQPQIIINTTPHHYLPGPLRPASAAFTANPTSQIYHQQIPAWQKTPSSQYTNPITGYQQPNPQVRFNTYETPATIMKQNNFLKKTEPQPPSNSALSNFLGSRPPLQQPPQPKIQSSYPISYSNTKLRSTPPTQSKQYPPTQIQRDPPDQRQFVVQTFKQGSRYQGHKLNGMRHGQGKFFYQDGGLYDGDWKQNKMEGQGKLYYQSGNLAYDGGWSNDQFSGFGRLYNQQAVPLARPFNFYNLDDIEQYWTLYQGQFLNDVKHGKGKIYLSNKQWFQGVFIDDNASGPGMYHTCQGQDIHGIWRHNQLQQRTN